MLNALLSVVELDLSRCHMLFSAEAWDVLVNTSPAVEALAFPLCSLFRNGDAHHSSSLSSRISRSSVYRRSLSTWTSSTASMVRFQCEV